MDYPQFSLPCGNMQTIGYICQQVGVRLDRPVIAYDKWANRIPGVYRKAILGEAYEGTYTPSNDPYCLSTIKHFRSLIPMAQECNKPIFHLTAADGAIGSHANAVQDARSIFRALALNILDRMAAVRYNKVPFENVGDPL